MKVFVTGGTGAIGSPAVSVLVAAGHEVTALARSPEKAGILRRKGARPLTVSIFDVDGLTSAFEGHDVVVNLATAIPPTTKFMQRRAWIENDRIRIDGSKAVADAALAAGVPRLIQESVAMLYSDHGGEWITEDGRTDRFPMAEGNHAAEASCNRFTSAGGCGVVLRFGWFYGPGATHSEVFLDLARRGVCVMMGRPQTYVSSIHMEDGGAAVEAALRVPAGTYNVVDNEPLTKRAYADALAAAAGRRRCLRAPGRLALLLGERSTSLTRSLRVSNRKFREASNWSAECPSAREGWLATSRALAARRN